MDKKFLKIIIAIFIVLAAITAFPWIDQKLNGEKKTTTEPLSVNLATFTPTSVNKISIKKGDEEKVLSRKNDVWLIGTEEADQQKVQQLFNDFSQLKIKEVVAQNENNHAKFQVTKENGIQLVLNQNGKDSIFFIGKTDQSAQDFFMRKDGIKNVYLVSGGLREKLTWAADKWKPEAADTQTEDKK